MPHQEWQADKGKLNLSIPEAMEDDTSSDHKHCSDADLALCPDRVCEYMEKSRSFPPERSWVPRVQSGMLGSDGRSNSYSFNSRGDDDPELKRKRRVAAYNVFTAERRIKSQVKNSFKWIKTKLADLRYSCSLELFL